MINDQIVVRGARVNNLKNVDVTLPRNKLIVMSGLSGSGKSSLAFDTIYAEGQRRYVESLSSYARQFLGGIEKPDVDAIEGLSPAISIDQKTTNNNPRSTVGTITEIYDYLRLLYARVGIPYCPNHHQPIEAMSITSMVKAVMEMEEGTRFEILARIANDQKGTFKDEIDKYVKEGYIRAYIDGQLIMLEDFEPLAKNNKHTIDIVVDRLVKRDGIESRVYDSLETTLKIADNIAYIKTGDEYRLFSANYACPICGFSVPKLEPRLFSFNAPLGACPTCKGLGITQSVDTDLLIPDDSLSIAQGGIRYYKNIVNTSNLEWQQFKVLLDHYHIDVNKPLKKMSKKEMDIILYGSKEPIAFDINSSGGNYYRKNQYIEGVKTLIERRYVETTSEFSKEWYSSFMVEQECSACHGARLNPSVLSIKVGDRNIYEFTQLAVCDALDYVNNLKLDKSRENIARLLLNEMRNRLGFLSDVGLDYVTLNRYAGSLSGGEAQRIRLATQIGSALTGVLYVLDEPSIGLHQRDNRRLIDTLKKMRDLGNTLIVVEHDEETIESADYIVDVGPYAGKLGGEIVACGSVEDIKAAPASITGDYLAGRRKIDYPEKRKKSKRFLKVKGAAENNLKNIDVELPLGTFIAVSGVSGSGKSTLVNEVIAKAIKANLGYVRIKPGKYSKISGLNYLDKIVQITQDPIGRTPRSNPATYTGVFDDIRDLFAETLYAKEKGYTKSRFSFNVKGGRCEHCWGDGVKRISMLFVPDVYVECEECHGKRYNEETLKCTYKGKNIYDVLKMSVDEAIEFFANVSKIRDKLQVLHDVGLGYIELGQSAPTLSGGEACRVKLASELQKKGTGKAIYILDEPTTGLHSYDVSKLIDILRRIVDNDDTVLVIEHNLDVLKNADYLIDLGPEGGDGGGSVVVAGTPEEVAKCPDSYTGEYLRKIL
ncbi:MAG: excinuclease ABC subunit UvrA [Erysipelotrichaceae bacterium]|nr:excinuclease ABC subunit UvrA [Erysipelotrichaceae bacterium]